MEKFRNEEQKQFWCERLKQAEAYNSISSDVISYADKCLEAYKERDGECNIDFKKELKIIIYNAYNTVMNSDGILFPEKAAEDIVKAFHLTSK
jgi:hypothetical protein